MAVVEGVAAAITAAVVQRWIGGSELVGSLADALAEAGGSKAAKKLEKYFKADGRAEALDEALKATMHSLEMEGLSLTMSADGAIDASFL
ncbi:MAG: hypothetical protein AAGD35_14770, partial [Actinomycetota bacterium]